MKDEAGHGRETWDTGAPASSWGEELATEIMNIMEQGILVWDADGICELHNTRVFEVLELRPGDLMIGTERGDFRARAIQRGEMSEEDNRRSSERIAANLPYAFDRHLPSGRVVFTSGRPARNGAYVVTYTDVTEARSAQRELEKAKARSEEAEARAREILQSERARQDEAHRLANLDEWLQSCKSLHELFMIVQTFMARMLPGSSGELYTYSNSRDVLDGVCSWGETQMHHHILADSCWSLRRGRAYEYTPEGLCFPCDHTNTSEQDYICVPIVAHGDTVGMMHVTFAAPSDDQRIATLELDGVFARRCGEHISMAIANVKLRDELRDQSIRDPLTGLFNRRYFIDALNREISLADRKGIGFGLISFDADKFKLFNDNHGHDAGDAVLRHIGERLREVMVNDEVACRVGGEEFAVLVPESDLDSTEILADRLRVAIEEVEVPYLGSRLPRVTVSCGVAAYPESAGTVESLMRLADGALYRAKEAGRNRVCRPA